MTSTAQYTVRVSNPVMGERQTVDLDGLYALLNKTVPESADYFRAVYFDEILETDVLLQIWTWDSGRSELAASCNLPLRATNGRDAKDSEVERRLRNRRWARIMR